MDFDLVLLCIYEPIHLFAAGSTRLIFIGEMKGGPYTQLIAEARVVGIKKDLLRTKPTERSEVRYAVRINTINHFSAVPLSANESHEQSTSSPAEHILQ